ncbi:MAG: A/G-specific adenine glycosylase [Patiriisocius sp.]|jgi:A/G-specific adenine glycosylase
MTKKEEKFVQTVKSFYAEHGRHSLPWRKTKDAYRILVSEMMLQQTQVDRVIPKYKAFLAEFPTVQALADASLGSVLTQWQGLGYNRRAKMLHNCAKEVVVEHKGNFPKTHEGLMKLPGIGPYTAGAVMAFAYNLPVPLIETNVRTVYLHHFFGEQTDVPDREILALATATLDTENPREWYSAIMDYGTYLKKEFGNPNSKSRGHTKQSAFQGSDRQIRGAVLRTLSETLKPMSREQLLATLSQFEDIRVDVQIEKLFAEEMISQTRKKYHLPK